MKCWTRWYNVLMNIQAVEGWQDYELLDSGEGKRLERFGEYTLIRPDPQIIWQRGLHSSVWAGADAVFERTATDNGKWVFNSRMPEKWLVKYNDLSFWVRLTPFKHTGLFPEQAVQWDWMREKISKSKKQANILNLFGYTGAASLAAAASGAKVTHVDASRPAIGWARENQVSSKLEDKPIRWILEDALKFTARESRRGVQYDGIIMDPPIYGHGPGGERWDFNKDLPDLLKNCSLLLSGDPLFVLINAYAISSSSIMLQNVLGDYFKNLGGHIEAGELAIKEKNTDRLLSTGIFGRWSR